ncbi:hypothetical protein Trydic_g22788 [Trypoxylus dichotomus]
MYRPSRNSRKKETPRKSYHESRSRRRNSTESEKSDEIDYYSENETKIKQMRTKTNRKDTGYSTGSSLGSTRKNVNEKLRKLEKVESKYHRSDGDDSENHNKRVRRDKQKLVRSDKHTKGDKKNDVLSEESRSDVPTDGETKRNLKTSKKKIVKQQSNALSSTDMSSE